MKYRRLILLMALGIGQLHASANRLEDTLNDHYKDHTYTLRQPMTSPTQQYDSQGNSPTASALGPWTVYGRMQIKKISVGNDHMIVEGKRVGMKFDKHSKTLVPTRLPKAFNEDVRLQISLQQPLDSDEQARAVLSHIFAFTKEDFLASVPELWRNYLTDNIELYADDGKEITFRKASSASDPALKEPSSAEVYRVGNGVTVPRPLYQPDPDYSEPARAAKFQGTTSLSVVIDASGRVRDIRVTDPLGLGLDDQAAAKVRSWKFEPAQRYGKPVNVQVRVEVEFHLY